MSGSVRIARGARAAEAFVLAEIQDHVRAVREDPARLTTPLRIVVPSRSLREHLAAAAVRRAGVAVAGVALHTLRSLAFEILRRAGEPVRGGDVLFPVLVRQCARREPVLRRELDALQDGFGAAVATVSDLLDAGFEPAQAEALEDCIHETAAPEIAPRARAILRTTLATVRALEERKLEHRSALFRRARLRLERDSDGVLPSARVLIHGYADATGVQLDLIRALVAYADACVVVDRPDDPAAPERPDPGSAFTARLLERLETASPRLEPELPAPPPARPRLLRASGAHAEARAVAERVRGLLDAGAEPERIGVVARQLEPYVLPLRQHLRRLGVPFSGAAESAGPLAPAGRGVRALLDLVRRREATPADRWLDALAGLGRARRADLRTAFHALGAGRVRDVAELDLARRLGAAEVYRLPVRQGLRTPDPESAREEGAEVEESAARAVRRPLRREALSRAVEQAGELGARFARWSGARTLAEHTAQLEALLHDDLGWTPATPGSREVAREIELLRERLPDDVPLDLDDFVLLLLRALRGAGHAPLGGAGGGVAVLGVVEARARSFEQLFVLGLNRDLFPRAIAEDPLLPDAVRKKLETPLPDIPLKSRGYDEERYLFAQLVSASPEVTLSWQAVSDDGKEKTPSPLVERIRLARGDDSSSDSPAAGGGGQPRTAHEHAIDAGLAGEAERFRATLALADADARAELGLPAEPDACARRAAARVAVREELERGSARSGDLGPYFGFVGPVRDPGDPRNDVPSVTALENLSRCGWRTFIGRVLRVEAVPDAHAELPALDALLVGNLVHSVLEAIAREGGVSGHEELARVCAGKPRDVAWPGPERFDELLHEQAEAVVQEAGISLRGFPKLLAERARPYLASARKLEWSGNVLRGVLGVEVEGEIEVPVVPGRTRPVRFRADRVDAAVEGARLVDYKTSRRPVSAAVRVSTRRDHLLRDIARGHRLQVPAYAFSVGVRQGSYLFANPELAADLAQVPVEHDDAEARALFESTASTLLRAWEQGSFLPRFLAAGLREAERQCESCEFVEACQRGDSAASQRLRSWIEGLAPPGAEARLRESERALFALWSLSEAKP